MSEHEAFKKNCTQWRRGRNSDELTLKQTAHFLHATADWISVRDFLIEMGMSNKQILDWFSENDFGDFEEAVEQGWGWPEDHPLDD